MPPDRATPLRGCAPARLRGDRRGSVRAVRPTSGGGGQVLFCRGRNLAERLRVAHGQVRQNLAVNRHPGTRQAVDQPAVAKAVQAGGRVDALNPELAELSFFDPPVAVSVDEAPLDGLPRLPVLAPPAAGVTLGKLQGLLSALARLCAAFYPWHGSSPGGPRPPVEPNDPRPSYGLRTRAGERP